MLEESCIILLAAVARNGELIPDGSVELESFIERGHGLSGIEAGTNVTFDGVNSTVLAGQALS